MGLESIGKHISEFRHLRKLRQEDLAEITGLSTNYIGAVERGEKIPSLETFIDILNALSVSADMVLSDVLQEGYQVMIKSTRIYSLSFLCSNLHGLAPFLGNKKGTTLMVIETNKTVPIIL